MPPFRCVARRGSLPVLAGCVLAIALALVSFRPAAAAPLSDEDEGRVPTAVELEPSIEAAFPRQSYAPGSVASLAFFNSAGGVSVQLFRVGEEPVTTVGNDEMQGVQVGERTWIGSVRPGSVSRLAIGRWSSGLYYARLTALDGRLGFAPFVLRPLRLGTHRVAVVMPTLTWQAYNLRDEAGGKAGTWYADWKTHTARLGRPFLNRGVPPHFRSYDLPFLHWLAKNDHDADYLADSDLYGSAGSRLAAAYDLIVFPGHHEYVTSREYDAVQHYRDLGGNLAFLSANNFFRRVDVWRNRMTLVGLWRDLGRPEAALLGTEYRANDRGRRRGPWILRTAPANSWLFAGTALAAGGELASGGVEIDQTTADSPRN